MDGRFRNGAPPRPVESTGGEENRRRSTHRVLWWRTLVAVTALLIIGLLAIAARRCARPCQSTVLPERKVLCICPDGNNDHVTIVEEGVPCRR